MSRFLTVVSGEIRSMFLSMLSRFALAYTPVAVHTLSLVEAIRFDRHVGVFKRLRKVATHFRRS